ncbi:MAG: outer membrane lipoprotein carrier protein LolA [Pseudomonadota bacterium]
MIHFLSFLAASGLAFSAQDEGVSAELPSMEQESVILAPVVLAPPQDLPGAPEPLVREEDRAPMIDAVPAEEMMFSDLTDQQVFDRAASALADIRTMRARFTQFSPSGATTTGQVTLRRPGQLRFDYDDPSPQLIVATGGLVYIHDAELETTDSYPVGKTPLRFLLDKRLDQEAAILENVYRGPGGVSVVIAAADEDLQGELALIFLGEEMALSEWAVFEPSGAVTRVALSDIETDVRLQNRLFRAPDAGGSFLRDR